MIVMVALILDGELNAMSKLKISRCLKVISLVTLASTISACSQLAMHKGCMSEVEYDFAKPVYFSFIKMEKGKQYDYLSEQQLPLVTAFEIPQQSLDGFLYPEERESLQQVRKIKLLGDVIQYTKSPLNPFDASSISFLATFGVQKAWITRSQLTLLAYNYPSAQHESNEQSINQNGLTDRFVNASETCAVSTSKS